MGVVWESFDNRVEVIVLIIRFVDEVRGEFNVFFLKSYIYRVYFFVLLVEGESIIENFLVCDDIFVIIEVIRFFGVGVDGKIVVFLEEFFFGFVYVREFGIMVRFLIVFVGGIGGKIFIDGVRRLRERLMDGFVKVLKGFGVEVDGFSFLFIVKGFVKFGRVLVDVFKFF